MSCDEINGKHNQMKNNIFTSSVNIWETKRNNNNPNVEVKNQRGRLNFTTQFRDRRLLPASPVSPLCALTDSNRIVFFQLALCNLLNPFVAVLSQPPHSLIKVQ